MWLYYLSKNNIQSCRHAKNIRANQCLTMLCIENLCNRLRASGETRRCRGSLQVEFFGACTYLNDFVTQPLGSIVITRDCSSCFHDLCDVPADALIHRFLNGSHCVCSQSLCFWIRLARLRWSIFPFRNKFPSTISKIIEYMHVDTCWYNSMQQQVAVQQGLIQEPIFHWGPSTCSSLSQRILSV